MNIMFFLKPKSELAYIYDYHTLRQAMEIMEYHKYSCVPILNKEGKYVGSITEGDVLWALKKLDIFNIKEAEDISIMKIKRRVDYQCVTAESISTCRGFRRRASQNRSRRRARRPTLFLFPCIGESNMTSADMWNAFIRPQIKSILPSCSRSLARTL